eukprot:CAMPEP_0116845770 /NCGR_PEP_ID=MMETSP0418-20121206/13463_1 /TAXON_ID=1158023 /ORGANISM="Astrosyne radiata, Strain 13vi08-1A" /LENGTH=503 /DNA_ID=CAMNT_0004476941 /DNA_START=56 /DNA_END=1567 /DNA_ORIENTATION=-
MADFYDFDRNEFLLEHGVEPPEEILPPYEDEHEGWDETEEHEKAQKFAASGDMKPKGMQSPQVQTPGEQTRNYSDEFFAIAMEQHMSSQRPSIRDGMGASGMDDSGRGCWIVEDEHKGETINQYRRRRSLELSEGSLKNSYHSRGSHDMSAIYAAPQQQQQQIQQQQYQQQHIQQYVLNEEEEVDEYYDEEPSAHFPMILDERHDCSQTVNSEISGLTGVFSSMNSKFEMEDEEGGGRFDHHLNHQQRSYGGFTRSPFANSSPVDPAMDASNRSGRSASARSLRSNHSRHSGSAGQRPMPPQPPPQHRHHPQETQYQQPRRTASAATGTTVDTSSPSGQQRLSMSHGTAGGSNHNKVTKRHSLKAPRRDANGGPMGVTFGRVSIRDYERILSDNPSCMSGPSIGIGWRVLRERHYKDVEVYEQRKGRPPVQSDRILLNREQRERMLLELGYSQKQIAAAVRLNIAVKNRRKQTVHNLGASGMEEMIETAGNGFKRLLFLKKRK